MHSTFSIASPSVAASLLFDIVVFAGGAAAALQPLCENEPKPMLRICNRPMIWYCLTPWINAGCRFFFICVNENYVALKSYLDEAFPRVKFEFVILPLGQDEKLSTTCDVVREYLKCKEDLRHKASSSSSASTKVDKTEILGGEEMEISDKLSQPRDALLLSCDTLLPGVNLTHFISNFYASVASASVLLFRPLKNKKINSSGVLASGGSGKSGNAKNIQSGNIFNSVKPYTHRFARIAYEEKEEAEIENCTTSGIETFATTDIWGEREEDTEYIHHHRLHFISSDNTQSIRNMDISFGGRCPNLTFAADTVDAHVYLVREWVLHAISKCAGEGKTIQRDFIPLLTRSQHTTVNDEKNLFITPSHKINYDIPKHWISDNKSVVKLLNACPGPLLPIEADNLLVNCTIYEERENIPMRIYRIKTVDDFRAVNHEILAAKCEKLGLNQISSNKNEYIAQQQQNNNNNNNNKEKRKSIFLNKTEDINLSANTMALGNMVPDSPFTFTEKTETQEVQIRCCFMRSIREGNCKNLHIARSIIGDNVTLGENARVRNSIILDNAEIGANAVIVNSIIGSSAMVSAKVKVENDVVGPRWVVEFDRVQDD